jgi:tetratricopeptide (TPR) repeat protein
MLRKTFFHLVLIAALGVLAYSNTFDVPFQWDDKYTFLSENPIVKDLKYFELPSLARDFKQYGSLKNRYIGYLTFALNYRFHGLDVTGYHAVNLSVHILTAMLVYALLTLTFKTPFLEGSALKGRSGYIALFTGMLFVSHPVQTAAVTYIFQRLASLAALFYLLSLVAYIKSRLSGGGASRYTLYAISLVSAVLAMKSKENAFTLPVMMTLYEFLFFRGPVKPRAFRLMPLLLSMLIVPLTLVGTDRPLGEAIGGLVPSAAGYSDSNWDYLFTQFRVIVTYIRLLVLPVNQNIDYDYTVFHSLLSPQALSSLVFLFSLFGLALYLLWRSRRAKPGYRAVAFGVFWFFMALSVESGIIPIPMLINEYRIYLPSVGALMAAVTGVFLMLETIEKERARIAVVLSLALIPFVFAAAAYSRNAVWRGEESLWEDTVRKSPNKARPYNNLGIIHFENGNIERAIEYYRDAIRLEPEYTKAHNNLGNAYMAGGLADMAIKHYRVALSLSPDDAEVHFNLGIAYGAKGLIDDAIVHYQNALRLSPDDAKAHYNLAVSYEAKGLIEKAIGHYRVSVGLDPGFVGAYNNLGITCLKTGEYKRAVEYFDKAISLDVGYGNAYFNRGRAHELLGNYERALQDFRKAYNLGYEQAGVYLRKYRR